MAILHFINSKRPQSRGGLSKVLSYATKEEKTAYLESHLVSGVNCSPLTAYQEFINTKLLHRKNDGRQYYHFVQSFPADEEIPPQSAHKIALEFASHFEGYEIIVATHTDREHIHSHFIMNSVNFETGRKFHISLRDLENLMKVSDSIVSKYGYSVCVPKKQIKESLTNAEYYPMKKGESWKMELILQIEECMQRAETKEEFISLMERDGYAVNWASGRTNITYTTPKGKKCRDKKLLEGKFLKQNMEQELLIRQAIQDGIEWQQQETGWEKERERFLHNLCKEAIQKELYSSDFENEVYDFEDEMQSEFELEEYEWHQEKNDFTLSM